MLSLHEMWQKAASCHATCNIPPTRSSVLRQRPGQGSLLPAEPACAPRGCTPRPLPASSWPNTCAGSQPPAAAPGLTGQACAAVPAAGRRLPGRAGPRPSLGEAHAQAGTRGLGRSPGSRGEERVTGAPAGPGATGSGMFHFHPRKAGGGERKVQ